MPIIVVFENVAFKLPSNYNLSFSYLVLTEFQLQGHNKCKTMNREDVNKPTSNY